MRLRSRMVNGIAAPEMLGKAMRQRKSSEMAPGADLRKDLSLENEMYWLIHNFGESSSFVNQK